MKKMRMNKENLVDLVSEMTIGEKVGQLNQFGASIYEKTDDAGIEKLIEDGKVGSLLFVKDVATLNKWQKIAVEKSRLHIPLLFANDIVHGVRTIFPTPLAESCSWEPDLARKTAELSALEGSALGYKWTYAPMVDVVRDSRWGRVMESFGEDVAQYKWAYDEGKMGEFDASSLGKEAFKATARGFTSDNLRMMGNVLSAFGTNIENKHLGIGAMTAGATLFAPEAGTLLKNIGDKFQQYEELFYIGSAKILFTAFLVEWFFTGIENFRYITIRSILIKILYVASVFVLVHDKSDYRLYFLLNVLVVVINAIINMIYVRKFVKVRIQNLFELNFLKQNISLGIYAIMTSMYLTFNVMFLGLTSGNIEVGYYTTAFKLYSVVLGFFTAFTNVMLPRMSFLLGEGDNKLFQQLIDKSFDAMCTCSIPMILCSIVLAPQIIYVLSGSGYEGAILPMRIIMPAILLVGIAQVLAIQVLMPMRKDKVLFLASLLGATVSILINIFLVPHMQSIGTAIVLICSELMVTLVYVVYTLRHKLAVLPYRTRSTNIVYSRPGVLMCYLWSELIKNDFIVLGVAMFVSVLYWIILQINLNTQMGLFLRQLKV